MGVNELEALNEMHEYFAVCAGNAKGEARKKFLRWMDALTAAVRNAPEESHEDGSVLLGMER